MIEAGAPRRPGSGGCTINMPMPPFQLARTAMNWPACYQGEVGSHHGANYLVVGPLCGVQGVSKLDPLISGYNPGQEMLCGSAAMIGIKLTLTEHCRRKVNV